MAIAEPPAPAPDQAPAGPVAPEPAGITLLREIGRAIDLRKAVAFDYHGQPRRVDPHSMGTVTAGYTVLHGWQTGGGSNHGAPPLWGYFRLDDVEDLVILDQEFKPQEKYRSRFVRPLHSV